MRDPVPSLRRLFALRQFETFAGVGLPELSVIAENVRDSRFAPGSEVAKADVRLPALHLVLEGRIEARAGAVVDAWGPRDAFGFLEVLAGRPLVAPAISTVDTHTLQLRSTDTLEILEDNFGIMREVIRGLASRLRRAGGFSTESIQIPEHRLTLVERIIVLRQQLPFAGSRLQPLAAVAQGCEEVVWTSGTAIARADQLVDAVTFVVDGTLRVSAPDRTTQVLRAGDAIGALEALAGERFAFDIEATSRGRAIRCPASTILDVLEDHGDLGLAMVSNLAGALLDRGRDRNMERDLQSHLS